MLEHRRGAAGVLRAVARRAERLPAHRRARTRRPSCARVSVVAANYGLARRNLGAVSRARPGADGLPAGDRPVRQAAASCRASWPRSTTSEARPLRGARASPATPTSARVKKAFRALARELHPDVNSHDPEAEEKFKEAAEAYEILSDAERRATYDRYGFEGLDSRGFASAAHGFGSFADIFDAFFGGGDPFGGVRRRARGPRAGRRRGRGGGDHAGAGRARRQRGGRPTTWSTPASAATATGAEPGTPIETCPRCGGRRAAARGHAHGVRPARARAGLRRLRRRGPGARRSRARRAAAAGARRVAQDARRRHPGRHRRRAAHPPHGPRPRRRARRPAGRPLRARARGRGRALRARRQRPGDRGGPARARRGARHDGARVPTLDGDEEVDVPAGTQPGHRRHAARPRHAGARRGAAAATSGGGERGDPAQPDRRASASCSRSCATRSRDDNLREPADESILGEASRRAFR